MCANPACTTAIYWKNGQQVTLSQGLATSIFVSGSDVYVAGTADRQAVYWKNGQAVALTAAPREAGVSSIAVVRY